MQNLQKFALYLVVKPKVYCGTNLGGKTNKGFMVNDYYRILVGPSIYGFPWRSIWK